MKIKAEVCIVGAGLCGALLACRLAEKGHDVLVLEKRKDLRWADISAGRSINLALSDRGLWALSTVGLDDEARKISIPMHGRMLHDSSGELRMSPYSGRPEDYINSISRSALNALLLDQADRYDNVKFLFETSCQEFHISSGRIIAHDVSREMTIEAKTVFGTDGAGSVVRQAMFAHLSDGFHSETSWLSSGYKELHIPPTEDGGFRIDKNALHIWPRGSFMTIALPNLDGSFTVTLFWPWEGENSFKEIDTEEHVQRFFQAEFPDLLQHLPDLNTDYFDNPSSKLGTLKCHPWNWKDKVCLMGDACHAIVPFYGQGMNAAFEDVRIFMQMYEEDFDGQWEPLFARFSKERKVDTDAIADLAVDNFYEMQDKVDDPVFIKKRKLERRMEQEIPEYFSKYSLVTFRKELPYAVAMKQGRSQDQLLLDLCASGKHEGMSLHEVYEWLIGELDKH